MRIMKINKRTSIGSIGASGLVPAHRVHVLQILDVFGVLVHADAAVNRGRVGDVMWSSLQCTQNRRGGATEWKRRRIMEKKSFSARDLFITMTCRAQNSVLFFCSSSQKTGSCGRSVLHLSLCLSQSDRSWFNWWCGRRIAAGQFVNFLLMSPSTCSLLACVVVAVIVTQCPVMPQNDHNTQYGYAPGLLYGSTSGANNNNAEDDQNGTAITHSQ